MAKSPGKDDIVAQYLSRLTALCDRGFALAIHIRYTRPTLLYQTYSRDWADHYSEKGYMLSDPVVHWGLSHTGIVQWNTLTDQDPEGVMAAAVSFGLTNGWTYATGPASTRTIAGLTRSGGPFPPEDVAEIIQIVDAIHEVTEGFDAFTPELQNALRSLI